MDIITESENLKESLKEFGNEIEEGIKVLRGHDQKGQETYRNVNKFERTRPVHYSVIRHSDAPIPEMVKEITKDPFPMTVERLRHLLQNETPRAQSLRPLKI